MVASRRQAALIRESSELKREIMVGLAMSSVELEEKQQKNTVDVPHPLSNRRVPCV